MGCVEPAPAISRLTVFPQFCAAWGPFLVPSSAAASLVRFPKSRAFAPEAASDLPTFRQIDLAPPSNGIRPSPVKCKGPIFETPVFDCAVGAPSNPASILEEKNPFAGVAY